MNSFCLKLSPNNKLSAIAYDKEVKEWKI